MPEISFKQTEDVTRAWSEMSKKRKYQFMIIRLENNQFVLDSAYETNETADQGEIFNQFKSSLPLNQCRFAMYRVDWDKVEEEGVPSGKRTKIVFISSVPMEANVKEKMLFASSKAPLKRVLGGFTSEVHGSPASIQLEEIVDKAKQYTK